jgi:outer membrane autotransporter protein
LAVFSLNGFHPANGNAFEILRSNGTRSGKFSTINDQLNFNPNLQRVDIYARNGVALLYLASGPGPGPSPSPTPPPGPTPTPGGGHPPVKPPVDIETPELLPPVDPEGPLVLPPKEEIAILDPTAEQLTSMFEIGFSGANSQRFNLNDRMAQIQQTIAPLPPAPVPLTTKEGKEVVPPPPPYQPVPSRGVWANGWGDFVNVYNDPEAKGYQFTTGGISAGIDYRITDHLAVGLFGGYSHTWTDLKPGNVDVDTGRGGLYATYFDPTGWWVNAGVWGGYNSYSTSRQAILGLANGSTNGYEVSTFGDAGYDIHCGNLTFGPVVSMQYTTVHIDSFSEHGSLVPLNVHSDSEDSLRTDAGARVSYTWHAGKMVVIPQVEVDWEHEFKYSNLPITVSAPVLNGATATLAGPNIGHDSLIINAGVGLQINPQISVYIGYQGQQFRGDYEANAVTGTFSLSF